MLWILQISYAWIRVWPVVIISSTKIVEDTSVNRIRVKDTDIGRELQTQINDLRKLLKAYELGVIPQEIKKD